MTSNSKNDASYEYLFKILIIGDSGVGYVLVFLSVKRREFFFWSLVKQRFYNDFHRIILLMNILRLSALVRNIFLRRESLFTFFCADFQIKTIEVDSKRCKVQIWDTAGQDRFKCVVGAFYRNANGVIICFDLTDVRSFRHINHWLEEVQRYCPDETQVYLVGTKSDLKSRRVISPEMIRAFTEKNQISYIETSAKANENVEKCFVDFTRKLLEHTDSLPNKPDDDEQSKILIGSRTKPVQSPVFGNCFADNKCTI